MLPATAVLRCRSIMGSFTLVAAEVAHISVCFCLLFGQTELRWLLIHRLQLLAANATSNHQPTAVMLSLQMAIMAARSSLPLRSNLIIIKAFPSTMERKENRRHLLITWAPFHHSALASLPFNRRSFKFVHRLRFLKIFQTPSSTSKTTASTSTTTAAAAANVPHFLKAILQQNLLPKE